MLSITCSSCQKKLAVKEDWAGKKVKCPACGHVTLVSAQPAAVRNADRGSMPSGPTVDLPSAPPSANASDVPTNPSLSNPDATQGIKPNDDKDASLTDFLAPPQAADEVGRLGDFRILKILGAGGMGVVFLGEDPKLGRNVAIKAMLPHLAESKTSQQRFLREARSAATLEHDHIVPIFHVGLDRGAPYIVMPFLKGEPLDERLKHGDKIPLAEILRIGREIAEALSAAHALGLVHRDIKPANVWLEQTSRARQEAGPGVPLPDGRGSLGRVKILDFGLARAISEDSGLTQQGAIVGTPAYMAPEQGRGEPVDAHCDLFSLGVVLYRMATGQQPFQGKDTVSTLMAVAMTEPAAPIKINGQLPQDFSDLVMKLLEKAPANRPGSAAEVVQALQAIETRLAKENMATGITEAITSGQSAAAVGSGPASSSQPTAHRRRPTAIALAALFAILALGGAIYYWQTNNGIVRIEINDPDIKVAFDKNGPIISGADKQDIKLTPGEFGLTVERGDLKFDTDKFILKRGETITLKIEWFKDGKLQAILADSGKILGAKSVKADAAPIAPAPTNQYALRFDEDARVPIESVRYDLSQPHTYEAYVTPITRGPRGIIGSPGHSGIGTNGSAWNFNIAPVDPKQPRFLFGPPFVLGQKTHVAGVYTDGMVRLFVDGKLASEAKSNGLKDAKGGLFQIGGPKEKASFVVSEVRISKVGRYTKNFTPQPRFEPDADTLALYHCDEGSGDVLHDSSGNNHHGKIVGAKWVMADAALPIAPPGVPPYALRYDGKAKVDVPSLKLPLQGPICLEAYVTPLAHPPLPPPGFFHILGVAQHFDLIATGKGLWLRDFGITSAENVHSPNLPPLGKRVHIAGVKNDTHILLFVDGKLVGQSQRPAERNLKGTARIMVIGGTPFQGTLDEVRISKAARYDKDFTPQKRFEPDADTLALYHFDEGSGDVLHDSSGNNHHGKIVGAKWVKADGTPIAAPTPGVPGTVNLLALIDLKKDIASGDWSYAADGLKSRPYISVAEFPYSPPDEYDFRLDFTLLKGYQIYQFLARRDRSFSNMMKGGFFALEMVGGKGADENPTASRRPLVSQKEQHVWIARVRNDHVSIELDGKEIIRWKTDYSDLSLDHPTFKHWAKGRRNRSLLAVGTFNTDAVFHKAEVVEISGRGTFTRPDDPAAQSARVVANVPPILGEKEAKKLQEDTAAKLKLPVEATNKIGMRLRLIPPAGAALPLLPQKAFYLGKYEVTQGEWQKVMGYNPSFVVAARHPKLMGMDTSNFPADSLSWYDSVEFCNKLSMLDGLKPYYELTVKKRGGKGGKQIHDAEVKILGGSGYHIPTDAEWEHGCRAWTTTKFHFGDKDENLLEYGWFDKNSEGRTHPVGEKKPNAFGLYDMHGNVNEWNEEMLTNATSKAPERVRRGGVWSFDASHAQVSFRARFGPGLDPEWSYMNGLRVARAADGSAAAPLPPLDPAWLKAVAAMKPGQQLEAVKAELMRRNPGFDGAVKEKIVDGVVIDLSFFTDNVADISPVRALPGLRTLVIESSGQWWERNGKLADLSPLMGTRLTFLHFKGNPVADLSPLKGLKLSYLNCGQTKVADLAPLAGMPLKNLIFNGTEVSDLAPLKGMPLTSLTCFNTKVADLTPLKGTKLADLSIQRTKVTDLSPLKGMPLKEIGCDIKPFRDIEILRSLTTLERINGNPAAEFWTEMDAKQAAFNAWLKAVAALTGNLQVDAVAAKLKERNPGFVPSILYAKFGEGGVVTEVRFYSEKTPDISPLRAFTGLRTLTCSGGHVAGITDLSPLKDLKLTTLDLGGNPVSDLSPLKEMKLKELTLFATKVTDLTPLKGMRLTALNIDSTKVADLSPLNKEELRILHISLSGIRDLYQLKGMNLTKLACAGAAGSDLSPLKDMKLTELDCGNSRISNLAPLKDMKLTRLEISNTQVSDLTLFKGMPLTFVDVSGTKVTDLSPLKGMKLTRLAFMGTEVSDLTPLKGMPLTHLNYRFTKVADLAPLRGMPLEEVRCDFQPERDAEFLRSIKTLKRIEGKAAAEFWKEVDAKQSFAPLFNGKDLTGWKVMGQPGWNVKDGVLVGETNGPFGWLMSDKDYADFELGLEYKQAPGGNSGIFLRAWPEGPVGGNSFMEIQLIDDAKTADPKTRTGALFETLAPNPPPKATINEWHRLDIRLQARQLQVVFADQKILATNLDDHKAQFARFPGLTKTTGRIGLQLYPGKIEFKNIRVRELLPNKAAFPPLDPAWLEAVAAMKPEEQMEAVKAELMKRNPGFDGKIERKIKAGVVTDVTFSVDNVIDIAPVRALTGLRSLSCDGSALGKGQLADLSPLKG